MLTVGIANYNHAPYLGLCLTSVFQFVPDAEVIVVDNASTDDSLDIIAQFPVAEVVAREVNTGECGSAYEYITEKATGDWLFRLDADDLMVAAPQLGGDYTYGALPVIDAQSNMIDWWDYRPITAGQYMERARETLAAPITTKGIWRTEFIRQHNLGHYSWPSTDLAEDFATALRYMEHDPVLHKSQPFMAYRVTRRDFGTFRDPAAKALMLADVLDYFDESGDQ